MKTLPALLALALLASSPAHAAPPPPPEARQFDFWIGDWDVRGPDGADAGRSHVESVADGHALLENWTDADGSSGKSLNVYNPARGNWQQFWVGSGTPVLELSGGLDRGSMRLTGTRASAKGGTVTDQISWTPEPDGSVRQVWKVSRDGGKTWEVVFDGLYRRRTP